MTRSGHSTNRDLAAALKRQSTRSGQATPAVRGADWRLAKVTAVNAGGTITADGIAAIRCLDTYSLPAVDDTAVITQSSSGNWLAIGRLATSGTWTPLTLPSGYQNPGSGYAAAYLREGRRIWLRGRIGPTSGTIADGAIFLTLPASILPEPASAPGNSWAVARDAAVAPAVARLEILGNGDVRLYQPANPPSWVALDGVTYTI